MQKTANERAVDAVVDVIRPLLKAALADAIREYYSELQWDEIVTKVEGDLRAYLPRCQDLNAVLSEGNLLDSRGNVNAAGVIEGLRQMAGQATRPGAKDKLTHLANHMNTVFTDLRLVKGGDRDG